MASLEHGTDGRPIIVGSGGLPPLDECDALPPPNSMGKANCKPTSKVKTNHTVTRDRFGTLNEFVDCSLVGLSRAEIATWLVLYRDTRNGIARTSQADIARRAGLSVRTVKDAVRRLRSTGLLVVVYLGGLNRGPSRYRVESIRKQIS
jgi:hypothetical protein